MNKRSTPGRGLQAVPTGRPSTYSLEVAQQILERIASGEMLKDICASHGMPPAPTVRGWVIDDREGFASQYKRARELACWEMADEIKRISDDPAGDFTIDGDGKVTPNFENVQRSRLRVDTRKWLLSKMLPRYFGDRVEVSGPGGGPVQMQNLPFDLSKLTPPELRIMEAMLERAAALPALPNASS